jgi:hypothetical protein
MKAAFYLKKGTQYPNHTYSGTAYSLCMSYEDDEKVPELVAGSELVEVIDNLPLDPYTNIRSADIRGLITVNPMNQEPLDYHE